MPLLDPTAAKEQEEISVGKEFVSGEEYRAMLKKHTRMSNNPRSKYAKPITTNMGAGWEDRQPEVEGARRPKTSCPETIYADAMVKSGVYF